jgi:hypothetical protein
LTYNNSNQTSRENVSAPGYSGQSPGITSPEQGWKVLRTTLKQHGVDELAFWNAFLPIITGFYEGAIPAEQVTQHLSTMLQTPASASSMRP